MVINPLTSNVPAANAASSTTSGTPTPAQSAASTESVFLQLLVTELQSQDPTAPMDATQMVGQMLSMNQLNELIAIQQTLQTAFPAAAGTAGTALHTEAA